MSNKKSLLGMFSCSKFNGDLSNWDISNVENISYMFYYNKYFDNNSLKDWNVSNIYDMEALFKHSNFNGNISSWDVSNVKTMEHLFFKSPFDGDISSWNINENCKTKGIVYLCDSFHDKYVINSKTFLECDENFKIWFEKNRNHIKDVNEPKEKVLDFFSFDNHNNLDKK